jgi:dynein heavy chain
MLETLDLHVSSIVTFACKEFGDIKEDDILAEPNIYTSFVAACEGHDATYMEIKGLEHLKEVLESKLEEYNEQVQSMNLVLFTDAMAHICKIARIIGLPCGNALLVGVGGSGRQSMTRLASLMGDFDVFQIEIKKNYRTQEWREDMKNLMR